MSISTFIVDAFTSTLFKGNQAAVCILHEDKTDAWMQQIAAEFNLSETAFLRRTNENHWSLRWFTPTCEMKLCGHATLASAHILANELGEPYKEFFFSTLSGILTATVNNDTITLDFPKIKPEYLSGIYVHESGIDKLNLNFKECYKSGEDILLVLESEKDVANYEPEIEKIAAFNARGLVITAASDTKERDFVSRFFAPQAGVNEDPVTGSAHCGLATYWSRQLHKTSLRAEQLSARTGLLDVICEESRVKLIGKSVTFLRGKIQ